MLNKIFALLILLVGLTMGALMLIMKVPTDFRWAGAVVMAISLVIASMLYVSGNNARTDYNEEMFPK